MLSVFSNFTTKIGFPCIGNAILTNQLHTSTALFKHKRNGPESLLKHNKKIYPPQSENEEPRPAVSIHLIFNIFMASILLTHNAFCLLFFCSLCAINWKI